MNVLYYYFYTQNRNQYCDYWGTIVILNSDQSEMELVILQH